jgi:dTDP-4-amino-4,6-dideoxy-D-glucose acyltransferase
MYLTQDQLGALGFNHLGEGVKISDKASIINPGNISIGNNSRIDDFCLLSAGDGGIEIGRNVHLACYTSLIGKGRITLKDFCSISSKISFFSSSDDFSGNFMTNPTVSHKYTNVEHAPIVVGEHVIIGAHSVIMKGVDIGEGASIGALSMVIHNVPGWCIYAGIPAKHISYKSRNLLNVRELMKTEEL